MQWSKRGFHPNTNLLSWRPRCVSSIPYPPNAIFQISGLGSFQACGSGQHTIQAWHVRDALKMLSPIGSLVHYVWKHVVVTISYYATHPSCPTFCNWCISVKTYQFPSPPCWNTTFGSRCIFAMGLSGDVSCADIAGDIQLIFCIATLFYEDICIIARCVEFCARWNVLNEVERGISTCGEHSTMCPCMNPLEIVIHVYIHCLWIRRTLTYVVARCLCFGLQKCLCFNFAFATG